MLESKDHQQIQDSSGVWDLTFAFEPRGKVGRERQIHSTSLDFSASWEKSVTVCPIVLQMTGVIFSSPPQEASKNRAQTIKSFEVRNPR